MKRIQVNHSGEYGRTEGEKDRERKIWGERERREVEREYARADFDRWSKSTTPENF